MIYKKSFKDYWNIDRFCKDVIEEEEDLISLKEFWVDDIAEILELPDDFFKELPEYTVHSKGWFDKLNSAMKPFRYFFEIVETGFHCERSTKRIAFCYLTEKNLDELKTNSHFWKFEEKLPKVLSESEVEKLQRLLNCHGFTFTTSTVTRNEDYLIYEDEYSKGTYGKIQYELNWIYVEK